MFKNTKTLLFIGIFLFVPLSASAIYYAQDSFDSYGNYLGSKIVDSGNGFPGGKIIVVKQQDTELQKKILEEQKKLNSNLQKQLDAVILQEKVSQAKIEADIYVNTGCNPANSGFNSCFSNWQSNKIEELSNKAVEDKRNEFYYKASAECLEKHGIYSQLNEERTGCECKYGYAPNATTPYQCISMDMFCKEEIGILATNTSDLYIDGASRDTMCDCIDGFQLSGRPWKCVAATLGDIIEPSTTNPVTTNLDTEPTKTINDKPTNISETIEIDSNQTVKPQDTPIRETPKKSFFSSIYNFFKKLFRF